MASLLHLDSSAVRSGGSVSRELTGLFADIRRDRRGGYTYRDVAADPVPPVGPAYAALGQRVERHGAVPLDRVRELVRGPDEAREWELTLPLIGELLAAETVLLGVPMYNLSVPASLKAWIDRVSFPGVFGDPETGERLLHGTTVVMVAVCGGGYGPGSPRDGLDFQVPYLRAYFGRLGVAEENLCVVRAELTRADDVPGLARFRETAARSLESARAAVAALAARAPAV